MRGKRSTRYMEYQDTLSLEDEESWSDYLIDGEEARRRDEKDGHRWTSPADPDWSAAMLVEPRLDLLSVSNVSFNS